MTVAQLINMLQVMPPEAEIQLSYYMDAYDESPYVTQVRSITLKEAETYEKYPQSNRPSRVILS